VSTPQSIIPVWHDQDDGVLVDWANNSKLIDLDRFDTSMLAPPEKYKTRHHKWARMNNELDRDRGHEENDFEAYQQSGSVVRKHRDSKSNIFPDSASSSETPLKESVEVPFSVGSVHMQRMADANICEPSNKKISAVSFHPEGNLLLVAGEDKFLRFFQFDGDKNEKRLSVRINDMVIQRATFRTGLQGVEEVLLCGRKPFFYSYNTECGSIATIPGPVNRGLSSLEHMTASSDGKMLAFRGSSGYVHICSGNTKQWISEIKMNSAVRSHCFLNDHLMATSGLDADVYVWDLRKTGRCVSRFSHDDGTCTSHLCAYSRPSAQVAFQSACSHKPHTSYLAVGAESGAVSIYDSATDFPTGKYTMESDCFMKRRSFLNLTTAITCSTFNSTGDILAISSNQKRNQIKLVHLPSCTVLSNLPTRQSAFQRVECMAFSPASCESEFFAVGNSAGNVLLFKICRST